jgi:hypothetical protein
MALLPLRLKRAGLLLPLLKPERHAGKEIKGGEQRHIKTQLLLPQYTMIRPYTKVRVAIGAN